MTVYNEIIALCEELSEQGVKVTQKAIIDRRGGSKRDISRAVRDFQALQQRGSVGQPALPARVGHLDPDTITDFATRLTETENLYVFCPHEMQRFVETIMSEVLPRMPEAGPEPHDNFLKLHFIRGNDGPDMELPLATKSAIIIFVRSSLPSAIYFRKIFAVAAELDLPVQIIQLVPSFIPDLPQGPQLHSLGLDLEKHGKLTRVVFASSAFAEIIMTARHLRERV